MKEKQKFGIRDRRLPANKEENQTKTVKLAVHSPNAPPSIFLKLIRQPWKCKADLSIADTGIWIQAFIPALWILFEKTSSLTREKMNVVDRGLGLCSRQHFLGE